MQVMTPTKMLQLWVILGFVWRFHAAFEHQLWVNTQYMQILGRREARILTLSSPVVVLHVSDMEIGCDSLLWVLKEQADLADMLQGYLSYLAHKMFFQCFHSKTLFSIRAARSQITSIVCTPIGLDTRLDQLSGDGSWAENTARQ